MVIEGRCKRYAAGIPVTNRGRGLTLLFGATRRRLAPNGCFFDWIIAAVANRGVSGGRKVGWAREAGLQNCYELPDKIYYFLFFTFPMQIDLNKRGEYLRGLCIGTCLSINFAKRK